MVLVQTVKFVNSFRVQFGLIHPVPTAPPSRIEIDCERDIERARKPNGGMTIFATPSGLAVNFEPATQGSALARATLGWRLVNTFGVPKYVTTYFAFMSFD